MRLALPIAAGVLFQTLYFFVDLYFVAQIGPTAIAGVAAAGNIVFLVMALTQIINAGTLALLSQSVGRKDHGQALLVFNQASALSVAFALGTLVFGFPLSRFYMAAVGAGHDTIHAGIVYLEWYLPGLALQFVFTAMGAALRATGLVKPTMIVQAASLTLNIILAPILIAGWFTGHPLGVMGAGLASSIAVFAGVGMMVFYFLRHEKYVRFDAKQSWPRFEMWRRLILIGLPAGGEIGLLFFYTAVVFALIRHFGYPAQAGFGVGSRITQAVFLPGMAIAFAAGPIIGQNFGAGRAARVRTALRTAILYSSGVMIVLTLICQFGAEWLIRGFTQEPEVVQQGAIYLHIISWNFVATGIVYSCSALFQGLGNTWPSLFSTGSRIVTFIIPAVWMATWPNFRIEDVWYLSVATVTLQAATSLLLVMRELRRRVPDTLETEGVPLPGTIA
ncbi:MAG TPA: MATE family efflux transporter [Rhizomicrobium sp.]|nr:MATE family efflux transporter [Rhizomicrobium sp.]